jgi:hypothetical protein
VVAVVEQERQRLLLEAAAVVASSEQLGATEPMLPSWPDSVVDLELVLEWLVERTVLVTRREPALCTALRTALLPQGAVVVEHMLRLLVVNWSTAGANLRCCY